MQRWFEAQLSEALDEAVCEYAASVLQPEGGEAPDLEEARSALQAGRALLRRNAAVTGCSHHSI